MMTSTGLPVIPPDRIDDLHNLDSADRADLILFMAGNQFMAMDALVRSFQKTYPELDQHEHINYYVCRLKKAPNPENAAKFLDFIQSSTAQNIYRRHGFLPHAG